MWNGIWAGRSPRRGWEASRRIGGHRESGDGSTEEAATRFGWSADWEWDEVWAACTGEPHLGQAGFVCLPRFIDQIRGL